MVTEEGTPLFYHLLIQTFDLLSDPLPFGLFHVYLDGLYPMLFYLCPLVIHTYRFFPCLLGWTFPCLPGWSLAMFPLSCAHVRAHKGRKKTWSAQKIFLPKMCLRIHINEKKSILGKINLCTPCFLVVVNVSVT